MISPLRRSDASARAAVARSCAFSFATASSSAADSSASAPCELMDRRMIARRRDEPQDGERQDAARHAPTMAVSPISA